MKVLITGGTGLLGSEITRQLLAENHTITYLSRHPGQNEWGIREFFWDPDRNEMDEAALEHAEAVINLAGSPVNRPWTPSNKNDILRSRVDSIRLLLDRFRKRGYSLKAFLSASAIGYYAHSPEHLLTEGDPPGNDFLSIVCQKWEQEAQNFEQLDIRTVRLRIGLVLSKNEGALPAMLLPVKLGVGSPLGNGRQWASWIHISDVAGIFIHCLKNEHTNGVYNAVGPHPVTNETLMRAIAQVSNRPFFMPNVPKALLKAAMGERSGMVLNSHKVSNSKIQESGYVCKYPELKTALYDLLK